HIFTNGGEFIEVARQDVGNHLYTERAARNVCKTYSHRTCFHFGVAVKQPPNFGEYKAHMVGLGLRTQTESGLEKNLVSSAKILQVDGCNGPIRNGHQRALLSADASGTQADVFDQSRAIAEATHISHAKHFIAQDRNSTEEIFDGLLRSEADGQSADTEAGERGAHVEAQVAEHSENAR